MAGEKITSQTVVEMSNEDLMLCALDIALKAGTVGQHALSQAERKYGLIISNELERRANEVLTRWS